MSDTFEIYRNTNEAKAFLNKCNDRHPAFQFTMEMEQNKTVSFIGKLVSGAHNIFTIDVYRKASNNGLLLHYYIHLDFTHKKSILKTMLRRAYKLKSDWTIFNSKVGQLKEIFKLLQ